MNEDAKCSYRRYSRQGLAPWRARSLRRYTLPVCCFSYCYIGIREAVRYCTVRVRIQSIHPYAQRAVSSKCNGSENSENSENSVRCMCMCMCMLWHVPVYLMQIAKAPRGSRTATCAPAIWGSSDSVRRRRAAARRRSSSAARQKSRLRQRRARVGFGRYMSPLLHCSSPAASSGIATGIRQSSGARPRTTDFMTTAWRVANITSSRSTGAVRARRTTKHMLWHASPACKNACCRDPHLRPR